MGFDCLKATEPLPRYFWYSFDRPRKYEYPWTWNPAINCVISFYPFHYSVAFNIGFSHLICSGNQMTGFYIKCNTGLKWIKIIVPII